MIFFWLITAILFLIIEMINPGLFIFLSFFFGALVTAGASFWIPSIGLQGFVFFGITACAFFLLTWWLKKEGHHISKTNVAALQGKQGIVLTAIQATMPGTIKVGGEIWSARSLHATGIPEGAFVEVIRVQGAHLIVIELLRKN